MDEFKSNSERPQTSRILNQLKLMRRNLVKSPQKQHKYTKSHFVPADINNMKYVLSQRQNFGNFSSSVTSFKGKAISQSQIQYDESFLNRLLPKETIRNLNNQSRKNNTLFSLFQQPQGRMKTDWINSKYRLF
ncbi:unnamed protein product (macronuclear) [Paramecium tetraurelia]|uniref:Uncharacterized protein n=1 Tax=Paramecium tetraurelia TaxID=5888 RepID=A0EBJ0_PARTE|nr:uncharacterized protein GSPATT00025391001 [Paramecium tetraurelia]CAK92657.1 unnamed protein product [Paramecium tetraurelia]|eukprot:XP_001460054.1 hypothetical protein (macronuclear) [Paramecium tetraurelia strain d4-2]